MKLISLIKASGEKEIFLEKKFRRALRNAGATKEIIDSVLAKIVPELYDGMTTKELYQLTRKILKHTKKKFLIGRYHLKKAIFELGPSGLPFENFVGKLLEKQNYKVEVSKYMLGKCAIRHEIDVFATKNHSQILVECKFHNKQGLKTTIQKALYVKARFDDITEKYINSPKQTPSYSCWFVTNTRFTSKAIKYGKCRSITMISWAYPHKKGLKDLIDSQGLHPITCLSSISKATKLFLLKAGIVLCSELKQNVLLLRKLKLGKEKIKRVLQESWEICMGP